MRSGSRRSRLRAGRSSVALGRRILEPVPARLTPWPKPTVATSAEPEIFGASAVTSFSAAILDAKPRWRLYSGGKRPAWSLPIRPTTCGFPMSSVAASASTVSFSQALGELTSAQFVQFLTRSFQLCATYAVSNAVCFCCIDWRHMAEMLDAGKTAFSELLNLAAWDRITRAKDHSTAVGTS